MKTDRFGTKAFSHWDALTAFIAEPRVLTVNRILYKETVIHVTQGLIIPDFKHIALH